MFTAEGTPAESQMPADWGKKIMHAALQVNGGVIFLVDDFPERNGGKGSATSSNKGFTYSKTFSKAGTYTFLVTVSDPSGVTATSSVTVVVDPTPTSIRVDPGSITLPEGGRPAMLCAVGVADCATPSVAGISAARLTTWLTRP